MRIRYNLLKRLATGWLLVFGGLIVWQCASHPVSYLTDRSDRIHETFWNTDSLIYGFLMEGTRYRTPVFHLKGVEEGLAVLILGGTHGNEPAGFEAAHRLLEQYARIPLKKGDLFIIPEANKVADRRNLRYIRVPRGVDQEMGNLNRSYPGNSSGLPMEREAQQITELIRELDIDLLLDLHESPNFLLESQDSTGRYRRLGQSLVYTPNEAATWLAMVVLDELNSIIPAGNRQFSLVTSPIKHSAAWSAGEYFQIPAFTIETSKQMPLEERIHYHVRTVHIIFNELGML
ncbi:MAG: succinylglutamate desuccinylase/aspartoacylase family protein [Candidatus Neomarinimicrobiota bacterium]